MCATRCNASENRCDGSERRPARRHQGSQQRALQGDRTGDDHRRGRQRVRAARGRRSGAVPLRRLDHEAVLRQDPLEDRLRGSRAGRPGGRLTMHRSSIQQVFIDAPVERVWELVGDPNRHVEWWPEMLEVECADLKEGCRYRGVVKGPFGAAAHDLVVDRFDDYREVSIFCDGTGVTTRFVLTEAQGGTFVEGCFTIEPNSIGMKVLGAVTGRRFMHSWLDESLENLRSAATASGTAAGPV